MTEPATPLPWFVFDEFLILSETTNFGDHTSVSIATTEHADGTFEERQQHAAYIVQACNAFPTLTAENERLLSLIRLADIQYMGCGGNLKPEEVISMMRQVLAAALGEQGGTKG